MGEGGLLIPPTTWLLFARVGFPAGGGSVQKGAFNTSKVYWVWCTLGFPVRGDGLVKEAELCPFMS